MIRVTTIREHAGRAGRYFSASGRTLPGPLGILLQFVILVLVLVVVALVAVPLLALGALFLIGGLVSAGVRGLFNSTRQRVSDDGRRNVRVITPPDA